jgi:1-acyl-sn-glycerol-3-phosphate acyltransferase
MRAELQAGNNIVASIHRDDLDTVLLPSVLERVGLHHSRPMSKIELFQNRVVRWGLHKLGAFAVDRNPENVDFEGLRVAQAGILRRKDLNGDKRQGFFRRKVKNGNETIYPEGTRIHKDTLRVAKIKRGVVMTALENSSYIVPVGFAGLSSEYEGEKPHRKLKAKDKSSWFGIRRRLVFSVGTPFKLEPLSKEASADPTGKPAVKEIRKRMNIVKEAMQDEVDNAYAVRGSSLEERFD